MSDMSVPQAHAAASARRLLLAIETTGAACSVAVLQGDAVTHHRSLELGRGHAERIVPLTGEVMGAAGLSWSEVSHFAACIGPGSFTGMRAGVAAARGLAVSLGVPALGVTAFEAIAAEWAAERGLHAATVALDLGRGAAAVQRFVGTRPSGRAERREAPSNAPDREGHEGMPVGPVIGTVDWPGTVRRCPDARGVALAASSALHSGRHAPCAPFYMRGPDAAPAPPALALRTD